MSPARQVAFDVLLLVEKGGYASDLLLSRTRRLDSRDAGLAGAGTLPERRRGRAPSVQAGGRDLMIGCTVLDAPHRHAEDSLWQRHLPRERHAALGAPSGRAVRIGGAVARACPGPPVSMRLLP